MSFLSEIIVYIWLLPVAAQIVLPLGILVVWSFSRLFSGKGGRGLIKKKSAVPL